MSGIVSLRSVFRFSLPYVRLGYTTSHYIVNETAPANVTIRAYRRESRPIMML